MGLSTRWQERRWELGGSSGGVSGQRKGGKSAAACRDYIVLYRAAAAAAARVRTTASQSSRAAVEAVRRSPWPPTPPESMIPRIRAQLNGRACVRACATTAHIGRILCVYFRFHPTTAATSFGPRNFIAVGPVDREYAPFPIGRLPTSAVHFPSPYPTTTITIPGSSPNTVLLYT